MKPRRTSGIIFKSVNTQAGLLRSVVLDALLFLWDGVYRTVGLIA